MHAVQFFTIRKHLKILESGQNPLFYINIAIIESILCELLT